MSPSQAFPDNDTFQSYSASPQPDTPYVVSEMSASSYQSLASGGVFYLGDENRTRAGNDFPELYRNGPLVAGRRYSMFVWAFAHSIPSQSSSLVRREGGREGGGEREGEGRREREREGIKVKGLELSVDCFPPPSPLPHHSCPSSPPPLSLLSFLTLSPLPPQDDPMAKRQTDSPRQYNVFSSSDFLPTTSTQAASSTYKKKSKKKPPPQKKEQSNMYL